MFQKADSKTKKPLSWFRSSLFLFLVIFNVALVFDDTGLGRQEGVFDDKGHGGGGGGGGGSKNTQFYNYGTVSKQVGCTTYHFGTNGVWVETIIKAEYYLKEVCGYGGNFHECSFGSERLTFQGGGC